MLQLEKGGCECDKNAVRRWKATARSRVSPTDVLRCASDEIIDSVSPTKGCTAVKKSILL